MMGWIGNLPNSTKFWLALVAIVLVCSIGLPAARWEWLRSGANEGQSYVSAESTTATESSGVTQTIVTTESNSTTVRNIGFIVAGALALVFAVWRGVLSQRQAKTSERQAETALRQTETAQLQVETSQRQTEIAQQGLLNERYQRGAEMLGNEVLAVRLGGIYALQRLAREHPGQYHIQVVELFCAFARHPTKDQDALLEGRLREDVQAVMTAVGSRGESGLGIEIEEDFTLDLREADLSYARLSGANLSRANLSNAKLDHANFFDWPFLRPDLSEPIPSGPDQPQVRISIDMEPVTPELTGLESRRANLSLAILRGVDLSEARLVGTELSGAELSEVTLCKAEIMYSSLKMATLFQADLSESFILDSDLSGAKLAHATLTLAKLPSTKLYGANLFGVSLKDADLSGAVLSKENGEFVVTGLTQRQLDEAVVSSHNPPDLTGVLEVGSRKQLVWNHQPASEGP